MIRDENYRCAIKLPTKRNCPAPKVFPLRQPHAITDRVMRRWAIRVQCAAGVSYDVGMADLTLGYLHLRRGLTELFGEAMPYPEKNLTIWKPTVRFELAVERRDEDLNVWLPAHCWPPHLARQILSDLVSLHFRVVGHMNNPNSTWIWKLHNKSLRILTTVNFLYHSETGKTTNNIITENKVDYINYKTGQIELEIRQTAIVTFSLSGFIAELDRVRVGVE